MSRTPQSLSCVCVRVRVCRHTLPKVTPGFVFVCERTNSTCICCACARSAATQSDSTVVWNINISAMLADVIKSRGSIAGV